MGERAGLSGQSGCGQGSLHHKEDLCLPVVILP